jgi:hypothetical protein
VTSSNAQVIAAALALVGVLVAAALTFIGVLFRRSIDERTLLQQQATEGRLRLETSIRAVELLGAQGQPATPPQQAGALFVLTNLGQLDFALALLAEIWPRDEISASAASWIVEAGILSSDEDQQNEACLQLFVNAAKMYSPPMGLQVPESLNGKWPNQIAESARGSLLRAIITLLLSRGAEEWTRDEKSWFALEFKTIIVADHATQIRDGAVLCLDALLTSPRSAGELIESTQLQSQFRTLARSIKMESLNPGISELVERMRTEWDGAGSEAAREP